MRSHRWRISPCSKSFRRATSSPTSLSRPSPSPTTTSKTRRHNRMAAQHTPFRNRKAAIMPSPPLDRQFVTLDSPTGFPTTAFGAHPLQGVYVTPSGKRPTTAFIATHVNLDFTEHYLG